MKRYEINVEIMSNNHGQLSEETYYFAECDTIKKAVEYIKNDLMTSSLKWDYANIVKDNEDLNVTIYSDGTIDWGEEL